MKTWMFILALALTTCLLVFGFQKKDAVETNPSKTIQGPSFEVKVSRPRSARPLFGILPSKLEARLVEDSDLGFDNASPGAKVMSVGQDRLELSADKWRFFIETDSEGRVAPETRLLFPMTLAGRDLSLLCRPGKPPRPLAERLQEKLSIESRPPEDRKDRNYGNFRTWKDAGKLSGHFHIRLAVCENAQTGKTIQWPPAPLTVQGNFEGLVNEP